MNIHHNLQVLRNLKNKRLKEIANALDISESMYSHYEKGTCRPPYEALYKLSDYYKVTIDSLLIDRYELTIKAI